jgi:hypothetical protein
MKATEAGTIVGTALTDYNSSNSTQSARLVNGQWQTQNEICQTGENNCYNYQMILVLVHVGWYDPQAYLASTGGLNFVDQTATSDANFTIPHYFTLNDALGNPLQRIGEFSDAVIANLRVGSANIQQLTANFLQATTANITHLAVNDMTIAGQNLSDYITSIVSNIINQQSLIGNQGFISPIASADEIHTNFISPLADDSNIAVSLHNSKFMILNSNSASGSAVATIDNQGNASFSGQLTSNSLNTNDATVSGTLHVGKIIADEIVGASTSATYVTNVTNIYSTPSGISNFQFPISNASTSGTSNFGLIASSGTQSSISNQQSTINGGYIDIASYSGQFAYVDNLSAGNAAFSQNLMVFGSTSLSDTSVVGQLSVDGNLILANDSINVLGADLNLQPLRQGGVSLMGGLVYFDTEGNLKVGGNAEFAKDVTVKGTLAAGVISPLPGNDLTVQLGNQELGSTNHDSKFIIHNSSNSAVLSVNSLGDLIASGAGTFAKLNLSLVQPAFALSPTEVVATGSAGTASVAAYQTEVTIDNPLVTDKSLIYITPVGTTFGQNVFLLRQTPDDPLNNLQGSFTVGITSPVPSAIKFNYLIVN